MNIEVVLLQDDPKLGKRGDVVKVSSGFAQNFLFPHQKAKLATPGNLKSFEQEKERSAKESAQRLAHARELAKKIEEMSLTIEVSAGEGDKLYGAINSQDIVENLRKQNMVFERKEVYLEEPIRKLGAYQIAMKPHPQVSATLKVWIVKKK